MRKVISYRNHSALRVFEQSGRPLADANPYCGVAIMTVEERENLEDLCNRITEEKDPVMFDELVLALNELLERTQRVSSWMQ